MKFAEKGPVSNMPQDCCSRLAVIRWVNVEDWLFKLDLLSSLQL